MTLSKLVYTFFVLVTLLRAQAYAAVNYCNDVGCSDDIGCNNNGQLSNQCAPDARLVTLSAANRNAILEKHNSLRNEIAGGKLQNFDKATRMATMQWDNNLAYLASLNVKQCQMKHDRCRNTPQFHCAGQNLAYSGWTGGQSFADALLPTALNQTQSWFDENKLASMSDIKSFKGIGKGIGHFIQIVQQKSNRVGCAIVQQMSKGWKQQYMACNYSYGNVVNALVYASGAVAASKCAAKNAAFPNLCSTSEVYDNKECKSS